MSELRLEDYLPWATTLDEIISTMEMYPLGSMKINHAALYTHLKTYQRICQACKKHNITSVYGIQLPKEEEEE